MKAAAHLRFLVVLVATLWHIGMAEDEEDADPAEMSPAQVVAKFDTDKDGLLSEAEFVAGVKGMAHAEEGEEMRDENFQFFQGMVDKYWSKSDANQDGKLNAEEIGTLEKHFQEHDEDEL